MDEKQIETIVEKTLAVQKNNVKSTVKEIINGMIEEGIIKVHTPRDIKASLKKIKDRCVEAGVDCKDWTISEIKTIIKKIKTWKDNRNIKKLEKAKEKYEQAQEKMNK